MNPPEMDLRNQWNAWAFVWVLVTPNISRVYRFGSDDSIEAGLAVAKASAVFAKDFETAVERLGRQPCDVWRRDDVW